MYQFIIWFDGGCKPNPGQGYGSFEIQSTDQKYKFRAERVQYGPMTSNVAEYRSLQSALSYLIQEVFSEQVKWTGLEIPLCSNNTTLVIRSDSRLLVEQLNGRWKCKKAHIQTEIDQTRMLLKMFGHWKLKWNPREENVVRFGH